jgi:hypothetical protein
MNAATDSMIAGSGGGTASAGAKWVGDTFCVLVVEARQRGQGYFHRSSGGRKIRVAAVDGKN